MKALLAAMFVAAVPMGMAHARPPDVCEVPGYLLFGESELHHVNKTVKEQKRLKVLVIGTRSSTLAGTDGAEHAYPARLEAALAERLPGVAVKVSTLITPRQTVEQVVAGLKKTLAEQTPDLVIWQAGTVDAIRGMGADDFGNMVDSGVGRILRAGADVILMNMQYSPRTETIILAGPYAENLRWVAQQRHVPLFDRFAIMQHWSDSGVFDFLAATTAFTIAEKVHDCLAKALAAQIIDAAQLGPMAAPKIQ